MEDKNFLIERALIAHIVDQVDGGKLAPRIRSHRDLANLVWPDKGETYWKHLRIGQRGKLPPLLFSDLMALSETLGMDVSKLLAIAELKLDGGWSRADDPVNRPKSVGRTKKTAGNATSNHCASVEAQTPPAG